MPRIFYPDFKLKVLSDFESLNPERYKKRNIETDAFSKIFFNSNKKVNTSKSLNFIKKSTDSLNMKNEYTNTYKNKMKLNNIELSKSLDFNLEINSKTKENIKFMELIKR